MGNRRHRYAVFKKIKNKETQSWLKGKRCKILF